MYYTWGYIISCYGFFGDTCSIRLFYDRGECIALRFTTIDVDEVVEVVARLSVLTQGCEVWCYKEYWHKTEIFLDKFLQLTSWRESFHKSGDSSQTEGNHYRR